MPAEPLYHSLEDTSHVLFFCCVLKMLQVLSSGASVLLEVVLSCGGIRFALGEQQHTGLAAHSASQP